MLSLLRRLIARFKRPPDYERGGGDMADAKNYAQARDWSPPPPGGPSGLP